MFDKKKKKVNSDTEERKKKCSFTFLRNSHLRIPTSYNVRYLEP